MASFTNVVVNEFDWLNQEISACSLWIHCRLLQSNIAKLAVIEDNMMFSDFLHVYVFEFTGLVSVQ